MAGMLGLPLPVHSIAWGDLVICMRQNGFKMPYERGKNIP